MRGIIPLLFLISFLILTCRHSYAFEPIFEARTVAAWGLVQGGPDANPVVQFNGDLTGGKTYRERFLDVPSWIVSDDLDGDGVFEAAVLFKEGTLRVISFSGGRFRTISSARKMAPGAPPLVIPLPDGEALGPLAGIDDRGDLLSIDYETGSTRRIAGGFSTLGHPLAADLDGDGVLEIAGVSDEGYLTIVKGRTQTRGENTVQLLPDTRITAKDMDGDGIVEIAALSKPSGQISPGRLGDDLEAKGLAVFIWDGRNIRVKSELELSEDEVFETLTPMVCSEESGDDPVWMLPVTIRNGGTQIRSYSYKKGLIREKRKGPVSDKGQWIHILGSARLGLNERTNLLAALITEGIRGSLELYRLDLAQTRITLRTSVDTHTSGSRLLEVALIGDMDKDGGSELLAPGKGMSSLVIYSMRSSSIKAKEIFNSSARIVTNLCPGDFNGDGLSDVMFGLEDGTLVILTGE
jgi:hypothetical protein